MFWVGGWCGCWQVIRIARGYALLLDSPRENLSCAMFTLTNKKAMLRVNKGGQ